MSVGNRAAERVSRMGAWVVGHNLAGYLPESDVIAFDDYSDALDALVSEMRFYADSDDDSAWELIQSDPDAADDEAPSMSAQVGAIVTDEVKPGHLSGDVGWLLEDNSGRMVSFWLQWSDESDADES